jgi:hypothetical protein
MSQQHPKKRKGLKITLGVAGAIIVIGVISSIAGGGSSDSGSTDTASKPTPAASKQDAKADGKPTEEAQPAGKSKSQADQFKDYVAEHGTPTEKTAVQHVTKVQGADKQNDILDAAEVYTDYSGGMLGSHASDGKLIASAFADWKDSANGLVTVYDAKGEILSNGNF